MYGRKFAITLSAIVFSLPCLSDQTITTRASEKLLHHVNTMVTDGFLETWTTLGSLEECSHAIHYNVREIHAWLSFLKKRYIISSADFIDNQSFIIDKPGCYVFCEDVTVDQNTDGPLIIITADNVTLNLKGHVLTSLSTEHRICGIQIEPAKFDNPCRNIMIKNGVVRGCSAGGIMIGNAADNEGGGIREVSIHDIVIEDCQEYALSCIGLADEPLQDCQIHNCTILECCKQADGNLIHLKYVENASLKNLTLMHNGSRQSNINAIYLDNVQSTEFENIAIKKNNVHNMNGVVLEGSTKNTLRCVDVASNTALNDCSGFTVLNKSTGNILRHCSVRHTIAAGSITGFALGSLIEKNVLQECVVEYNMVQEGMNQKNCIGFACDELRFCSFFKCLAQYNQSNSENGICAGFKIGATSTQKEAGTKYCQFIKNTAAFNNAAENKNSYGFLAISEKGGNEHNVYMQNKAYYNGVPPLEANQIVSDSGKGSNPGGVPSKTIRIRSLLDLNYQKSELSNLVLIG